MIDFFKAIVLDSRLDTQYSKIEFENKVRVRTGEMKGYVEGKFNGLIIRVYDNGFLLVTGSLHKFHNSGYHNASQFNLDQVKEALNSLADLLNTTLDQLILQNLEFGLNLEVSFQPKDAIDGFLCHRGKIPDIRYNGNYKEFRLSEYSIKIYNKGYQYGLNESILRVELKVIKSRFINEILDIQTMADLLNITNLNRAKETLAKKLGEIIQCYPLKTESIPKSKWKSSIYWEGLDRKERHEEKTAFDRFKSQQNPDMESLMQMINVNFQELTNSPFV